ncbi:hypothetical protein MKW98_004089 [Papaver atlanticum]|uniref:Uncharacterized protein n=1 Tax=Papaver atlanticum TaxID=357466 RepID=A0AAD4XPU5_9MAGN|nr:hypothetical protein MKW98_004089 [Papaver atlanticum]
MYSQLNETMGALLHICGDGCRTIGPRDRMLKGTQVFVDILLAKDLRPSFVTFLFARSICPWWMCSLQTHVATS